MGGSDDRLSAGARLLIVMAAFVIVVAGMRAAKEILVPFLLAIFVAVLCGPPLAWLGKRGIPRGLAIVIVMLAVVGVGTGIVAYAGSSVPQFKAALPTYEQRLKQEMEALEPLIDRLGLRDAIAGIEEGVDDVDAGVADAHAPTDGEAPAGGSPQTNKLQQIFDPGVALRLAGNVFGQLAGLLTNAFMILLTVVFILLEASGFAAKLRAAVKDPEASFEGMNRFTEKVNRYMAIKTWVSLLTGVFVGVWLWVLGVDYPVLWGLLAFLFNYIPNLGSLLAAIPAVLLAFVQLGLWQAGVAALGFVIVNVVIGSIIEPRFMGKGLGLSTLVVFVSLVFWGWALGGIGMVLSVPLTMTLKLALESQEDTRWIAVMLGSDPPPVQPGTAPAAAATGTPSKP